MKSIIITTVGVAVSVIAASIYFTRFGESVAQNQAVERITDVIPVATNISEMEVVESPAEPIPDKICKKLELTTSESNSDDVSTIKKQTEHNLKPECFTCPPDIPLNVFQSVSRLAAEGHDDQAAELSVIKEQLKGYRELKSFIGPDNVPDEVIRAIARKAVESHRNDFPKQFILINDQLSAYRELQGLERPTDIPESVFRDVVQEAAGINHPTDFAALLFEIKGNLETYRQGR